MSAPRRTRAGRVAPETTFDAELLARPALQALTADPRLDARGAPRMDRSSTVLARSVLAHLREQAVEHGPLLARTLRGATWRAEHAPIVWDHHPSAHWSKRQWRDLRPSERRAAEVAVGRIVSDLLDLVHEAARADRQRMSGLSDHLFGDRGVAS